MAVRALPAGIRPVDRDASSGGPALEADETVALTQPGVSLYFTPDVSQGDGTLFVTTR